MRRLRYSEVVRTIDLAPIPTTGGDDLRFRLEVVHEAGAATPYSVRLWRLEFYRLQPSFPQRRGRPVSQQADEQVLVSEDSLVQGVRAKSQKAALDAALAEIENKLGLTK
jgi:hypothetical protein